MSEIGLTKLLIVFVYQNENIMGHNLWLKNFGFNFSLTILPSPGHVKHLVTNLNTQQGERHCKVINFNLLSHIKCITFM